MKKGQIGVGADSSLVKPYYESLVLIVRHVFLVIRAKVLQ
jgi:hypothetical protein